jgi:hydroxymethylbilane synthase
VPSRLRLGTRASALALAQAQFVADSLDGEAEIVPIQSGQILRFASGSAGSPVDDKSRFVREIEVALMEGEVDVGVHSAKDLPSGLPDELRLAGVPVREDPTDAYVGEAASLDELPEGARIGTSSLRRRAQLLAVRPDLEVAELRGNVDTRLRKLAEGGYDGIVLASAGLRRLDREREIAFRFDPDVMTPSPGQGSLALETRREDEGAADSAGAISDVTALVELTAERAAVAGLDASCRTPVGVRAQFDGQRLRLDGFVGLPDGSEWIRDTHVAAAEDPAAAGVALAERLVAAGARDVLDRAERAEVG